MRKLLLNNSLLFVALALFVLGGGAPAPALQAARENGASLLGPWQSIDGAEYLNFKAGRMISFGPAGLVVRGIVRQDSSILVLRHSGRLEQWQARIEGPNLRLSHGAASTEYRRSSHLPPEVELEPLALGKAEPLPPERIQAIQEEIADRSRREQAAMKEKTEAAKISGIVADNTKFLVKLVGEVGWLDASRFGQKTSVLAVILAKHSHSLRLMMAVLPYAEKDLRLAGDGQTYAVLYDGLQIELGGKQRYGTQIAQDSEGKPYVLPVEEPDKIDERLKEMGLPPYSKYLEDASKILYNGQPIRMARADE